MTEQLRLESEVPDRCRMTPKQLLQIARLAVPGISTLQEQKSDRLDFHAIHVTNLARALQAAYELGRQEARNAGAEITLACVLASSLPRYIFFKKIFA